MRYQLDAAAEHIKAGSRVGINVNILNHKKNGPKGHWNPVAGGKTLSLW